MTSPAVSPIRSSTTATVTRSETDRARLHTIVHRGHTSARTRTRARKCCSSWATLERRVVALETKRNAAHCTMQWQFTPQPARTKLADL